MANNNLLTPRNTNAIAATTSSQARAIPSAGGTEPGGGPTLVFYNDGPSLAFVFVGANASITAVAPTLSTNVGTPGHMPLPVGQSIPISRTQTDQYWAVVSLSTSNVYCTLGDGR